MLHQRVLLLNPGIYDDLNLTCYPPWGALYIRDALLAAGHGVRVLDANGPGLDSRLAEAFEEYQPTAVGISCKLGNGARRFRLAVDIMRKLAPDVRIIAGGPLVSTFPAPENSLWDSVDALVVGDGERAMLTWLDDDCPADVVLGPSPVDMARSSMPISWPGLRDYIMPSEHWLGMGCSVLHVSVARGCTARCRFCYNRTHNAGLGFRHLSADAIMSGFDALEREYGVRGFYFTDDCTVDEEHHFDALCDRLISRGSPYRLGCSMQLADMNDDRLLRQMWRAGFRYLYVGIEAASERVRRELGKRAAGVDTRECLSRAIEVGFTLQGSVGIGWPTETAREMQMTLDLVDSIPELLFDAYRFLPLPGTPLGLSLDPEDAHRRPVVAFQDYSEYGANYSAIGDRDFLDFWSALCDRESSHHSSLFTLGD